MPCKELRSQQHVVRDAVHFYETLKTVPFNYRFVDCERPLVAIAIKNVGRTDFRQLKIGDERGRQRHEAVKSAVDNRIDFK